MTTTISFQTARIWRLERIGFFLRLFPRLRLKLADAYAVRGEAYRCSQQPVEARRDFARALQLDPSHLTALHGLAAFHLADDELPAAIALYDRVLFQEPNDLMALHNRGAARISLGDTEGVAPDIEAVIRRWPESSAAICNRGSIKLGRGDIAGALGDFRTALRLNPAQPVVAWHHIGLALREQSAYEEALSYVNKALQRQPQYSSAWNLRGSIYARLRDFAAAQSSFEAILAYAPKHDAALYNLASLAAMRDDIAQVVQWLPQAIEHQPSWRAKARTDPVFDCIRSDSTLR